MYRKFDIPLSKIKPRNHPLDLKIHVRAAAALISTSFISRRHP
nr:MAG TPA: hypothetical protein [Caudoviricetes sp.]